MNEREQVPRLVKGALVRLSSGQPRPRIVEFQFNPEKVSRRLEPSVAGRGSARQESSRVQGFPVETIQLSIELDALTSDAVGDSTSVAGVAPRLTALELLVYPSLEALARNQLDLAAGALEIAPPDDSLTLLCWGVRRVLPVRVTQMNVKEEAYDLQLIPLRATVEFSLRVLGIDDFPVGSMGHALFLRNHAARETLGAIASGSWQTALWGSLA